MAQDLILTTGEKVGNRSEDLPLPVNVKTSAGVSVDIATEAKQDDIIAALAGVSVSTDLDGLGDVAVGVTQVAIAITGTPKSIRIRADTDNTGIIYIGKTGVLSDGTNDFVRLEAGDEVTIDYNDTTNGLYAISDTAAQKINIGALL